MIDMRMKLALYLLFFSFSEGPSSFEMTPCNMVPGQRESIICFGLQSSDNIFWSIEPVPEKGNQSVVRCECCNPDCPQCYEQSKFHNFFVTRESTKSTLTFHKNLELYDRARVTCSDFKSGSRVSCDLSVIEAYRMPSCYEKWLEVLDDGSTGVECNGLMGEQSMYWTISTDGNVHRIAECDACLSSDGECPSCTILDKDFSVTRDMDVTELHVVGDVKKKNGSILSCVEADIDTYAECQMRVNIKPDKLKLDEKTCPTYVPEGSQLRCACGHSLEWGSPRAYVSWKSNTSSSKLTVQNVNMTLNGSVFVCRSVWGPEEAIFEELTYTVLVASGPFNVTLTRPAKVTNNLDHVTFTCMSSAASPSVNFTWNVPCATSTFSEQVSTCSVRTEDLMSGREVRCSASNSAVPELRKTASLVLPGTEKARGSEGLPPAVVGAVGAVVAVIVIVIVIIVVFVVRRRAKTRGAPPIIGPSTPANEDFMEYHNQHYQSMDQFLDTVDSSQDGLSLSMQPFAAKSMAAEEGTLHTDPLLQSGIHKMDAGVNSELYADPKNYVGKANVEPDMPGGSVDGTSGGSDVSDIYAQVQKPQTSQRKSDIEEK